MIEGKCGSIPETLSSILQRLKLDNAAQVKSINRILSIDKRADSTFKFRDGFLFFSFYCRDCHLLSFCKVLALVFIRQRAWSYATGDHIRITIFPIWAAAPK